MPNKGKWGEGGGTSRGKKVRKRDELTSPLPPHSGKGRLSSRDEGDACGYFPAVLSVLVPKETDEIELLVPASIHQDRPSARPPRGTGC